MFRKLIIIVLVIVVLIAAGLPAISDALYSMGVIPLAQSIRADYLTGTALTVIVALLILLPSRWRVRVLPRGYVCSVCEASVRPGARYCPACGSRVAA